MKTAQIIKINLILLLALLCIPVAAVAQEMIRTFTISPPTVEKSLDPGEITEGILKVINDTKQPLTFTATVQDFIVEDTKGTPKFLPEDTLSKKYSAASWIAVNPNTFTVEPNTRAEISYYIQVPADAKPGGHYAGVIFKPETFIKVPGTGTDVNTQIGSLVYITVKGPINENASILSFLTNWFNEYGPVKLNTKIKNMGDLHITPAGRIAITNIFGQKVQTQDLKTSNIFPEAARDYENVVGRKWMFGPYKATLLASYGVNNNLPLSSTVTFWVIPWKILLLAILTITTIVLGVLYIKKRKRKTKLAELSQEHQE